MRDNDRQKEIEKLMEEVLGKRRPIFEHGDKNDSSSLSMGSILNNTNNSSTALKTSDDAFKDLTKILEDQRKELEQMSKDLGYSESDYSALQAQVAKDFGIVQEEKPKKNLENSKEVFDAVRDEINKVVIAQNDAVDQMIIGFRRPFVMNVEEGKTRNALIISGPNGSGRHPLVQEMAKSLYHRQIFVSDDVYTINMGIYQSGSQEQLFLQDLFTAVKGNGSVIVFENFEEGYAPFLRMISDLVCKGRIQLNKRYISQKGQLVEASSGLISGAVDTLSTPNKYLVFITENKISKITDYFGKDFLDHIPDRITLAKLDKEAYAAIIDVRMGYLLDRVKKQLSIELTVDDAVKGYVLDHVDPDIGAESVVNMFDSFYQGVAQLVLESGDVKSASIVMKDVPYAELDGKERSLVKQDDKEKELAAVDAELAEIVGLNEVKDYIRSLQSHILIQQKRKKQGMKTSEVSKHMIFTGNPGTGKTTIARLISRYMKAIGALTQGQLVEVTRADLVGQYVGHTAPLTMSVIKSALGGVLFIDEAYSLYRGKDDSFGLEAIDTIVKAMEDHRDDLIVILAGYSKEMSTFLEANSGLKSRFPNVIEFKDYTAEELLAIAKSIAKGKEYVIAEEADSPLREYFAYKQLTNARESGNGRMARNIVEDAMLKQSMRLLKDEDARMDELKLEDFNLETE